MLDKKVVDTLKSIVGDENVLTDAGDLLTYSYDGTPDQPQVLPEVVVMPESEEEIAYPEIPVPIADRKRRRAPHLHPWLRHQPFRWHHSTAQGHRARYHPHEQDR